MLEKAGCLYWRRLAAYVRGGWLPILEKAGCLYWRRLAAYTGGGWLPVLQRAGCLYWRRLAAYTRGGWLSVLVPKTSDISSEHFQKASVSGMIHWTYITYVGLLSCEEHRSLTRFCHGCFCSRLCFPGQELLALSQPLDLEERWFKLVWPLPFDLSSMGDPTRSLCYS